MRCEAGSAARDDESNGYIDIVLLLCPVDAFDVSPVPPSMSVLGCVDDIIYTVYRRSRFYIILSQVLPVVAVVY